jgi:hypothetical protein
MYKKNCPTCGKEMVYKSKDTLSDSIRKNRNCRECMGKVISEKRKGMKFSTEHKKSLSKAKKGSKLGEEHKKNIGLSLKGMIRTDESKKRYSESKMGDKNPAKRQDVKDKIRKTVLKKYSDDPTYKERIRNTVLMKYKLDPTYKERISNTWLKKIEDDPEWANRLSAPLIRYFKNNPCFVSFEELDDFMKYKSKVRSLTNYNKRLLLKEWNGMDYYDNEYIKDYFNLDSRDKKYPTIDHKTSVVYGFKNGFSSDYIGSIDNICFTKRRLNSNKHMSTEIEFKKIIGLS